MVSANQPQPEPVRVEVSRCEVPLARPVAAPASTMGPQGGLLVAKREPLAVVSLVCGLTGIIPIVTQVIGLGTGIAGLVRIRRARRRGVVLGGSGFAITGIVSSGLVLLGWVAAAAALSLVGQSIAGSSHTLLDILPVPR